MRPIVQSMIAKMSSTRQHISSATRQSRSVVASSSTNNYKHDDIKCITNRCTVMSGLMDDRLQTILQHVSNTARLSRYKGRVDIHCRQFSRHNEQHQEVNTDESKVAIDEIADADLMAEVQEANERYVVYI